LQPSEKVHIWKLKRKGVHLYLLDAERLSEKAPEEEDKASWKRYDRGHFDYFAMNVLLQKSALGLMVFCMRRWMLFTAMMAILY